MNLSLTNEMLQLVAWFLALIEFILALYVLLLNVWHTANRHMSVLLLIFAINNFATGLMADATNQTQTIIATYLHAATTPAINPGLLIVAVVLLKPQWLRGRWRWIGWLVYGLVLLPALLTLVDAGLGTRLWYTGLDAATYTSGYVTMATYTAGSLSLPLRVLNMYVISTVMIIPLLYVALLDKKVTPLTRRLAWLLLGVLVAAIVVQFGLRGLLGEVVAALIPAVVFAVAYAYAAFQQMISERRLQRGRLQIRLTALILVVTVPILMTIVSFINVRAAALIEQVVVREQQTELLSALQQFQQISWTALVIGVVMVLALAWLTIRQALRPIGALTDTVAASAGGDLTHTALVESEDEIGTLARVFNSMTERLRGLIGTLEQRVADRTRDLERRSVQLEAAAQVAREAAAIRDVGQLLDTTVRLISEQFGFYHAGIFLVDEARAYAVLQAASSEGGQRMLARRHTLKVGAVGIVGYVAARGEPRIALDVGEDAVFFANPDLPLTRSEMALPLKVQERVIGVLDVQSTEAAAFTTQDVEVLQTLADQVSLAIENARLLGASQQALQELETLYGQRVREAWTGRAARRPAYHFTGTGVESVPSSATLADISTYHQPSPLSEESGYQVVTPIRLRGQTLGSIALQQSHEEQPWSAEEVALVEEVSTQIGLALENARLLDETQRRAAREQLTREITDRIRASTSVDDAMQRAAREMARALGASETVARIGTKPERPAEREE